MMVAYLHTYNPLFFYIIFFFSTFVSAINPN
jgi:hypothetical protein